MCVCARARSSNDDDDRVGVRNKQKNTHKTAGTHMKISIFAHIKIKFLCTLLKKKPSEISTYKCASITKYRANKEAYRVKYFNHTTLYEILNYIIMHINTL